MRLSLTPSFRRAFLVLLFGTGFILSFFHLLLSEYTALGFLVLVLSIVVYLAGSLSRRMTLVLGISCAVAAGIWLIAMKGFQTVFDTVMAVVLQFSGARGAVPVFAHEVSILTALCLTGLSFLCTSREYGTAFQGSLMFIFLYYAWSLKQPFLLICLVPSVIAVILMAGHAGTAHVSIRSLLPLAVLLTALSFLLVPQSGITIEPLKEAAETIRQRVLDYFFYAEPRNVFSLASEGYYPSGSTRLGGPANPDDHLVMVVKAPGTVYLRGTAKDEYTGTHWISTISGRRYLWISPRWLSVRSNVFNQALPDAVFSNSPLLSPQTVSVQMVSSSASDLFVPQRVRDLSCSGDIVPYFNQASEIFTTRDLVSGDAWTVRAPLTRLGQNGLEELITLCGAKEDADYESICEVYTRLPSHLPAQLYDLAHTITSGRTSVYQQVQALSDYLKGHCRYTLDVDPVPENVDFVSYFLLQTKEGYCTYFATALTVLCRMNGIPARYVEGFLVTPGASGSAYVTGRDGHAWTEVYFPGFGWLTVEATPSSTQTRSSSDQQNSSYSQPTPQPSHRNEPSPSPSHDSDGNHEPTPSPSPAPTPSPSPVPDDTSPSTEPSPSPSVQPDPEAPAHQAPRSSPLLWILLLLLAAAFALRVYFTLPNQRARREKTDKGVWLVWVHELFRVLHVMHFDRFPAETPASFFERISSQSPSASVLKQLSDCASAVFYGHELPLDTDIALYRNTVQALIGSLSWWQKIRLFLLRILPGRQTL